MIDMNIRKRLGSRGNVFTLDLRLRLPNDCRFAVLFGPSGSGKTLTLRVLSGLLTPDEGYIHLMDCPLFDSSSRLNLCARERRIGYMFQDFAHAGASVPLLGFGNVLWTGVKEAVDEQGFIGLFLGGFKAGAAGTSAALIFGWLASVIFQPKMRK